MCRSSEPITYVHSQQDTVRNQQWFEWLFPPVGSGAFPNVWNFPLNYVFLFVFISCPRLSLLLIRKTPKFRSGMQLEALQETFLIDLFTRFNWSPMALIALLKVGQYRRVISYNGYRRRQHCKSKFNMTYKHKYSNGYTLAVCMYIKGHMKLAESSITTWFPNSQAPSCALDSDSSERSDNRIFVLKYIPTN